VDPVLAPFLLGGLIAHMSQPGVEWLVRHRTPRGLAALVMMLFLASLVTMLVVLVLAVIRTEGPQLRTQIPVIIVKLNAWLQPKVALLGLSRSLDLANVRDLLTSPLESNGQTVALAAWRYLRTNGNMMITVVGNVVLMPLVLFYLPYDRHPDVRPHGEPRAAALARQDARARVRDGPDAGAILARPNARDGCARRVLSDRADDRGL
jgi:predicted PurR-regulated permease PerM